ncbi:MAG TPA: CDP-diacylglycerol--serine O-phosphatidyltransferase [Bacteroidales bacterium]|nr:CDP-diacylglycerol--serine O-phosphatidyltransferase [Bacteroidales bacterium]
MIRKHIPNAITCLNLFSGCIAMVYAFQEAYMTAALFIALAAIFDFFDGFAARLLKAYSPMGKELDSLADVVSFGVAPGVMAYSYISSLAMNMGSPSWFAWFGFLIPVFSALRLAKFNLDERQTSSFLGLPTPANALFWAFGIGSSFNFFLSYLFDPIILVVGILIFSALLVLEIPMFSLKFKNLKWKGNRLRYYFLMGSLLLLVLLNINGISACIVWYILLSVLNFGFVKKGA